jgi:hypothetical protein
MALVCAQRDLDAPSAKRGTFVGKIVRLPAGALFDELSNADITCGLSFTRMFMSFVDHGVRRKPILERYNSNRKSLTFHEFHIEEFFLWCEQYKFQPLQKAAPRKAGSNDDKISRTSTSKDSQIEAALTTISDAASAIFEAERKFIDNIKNIAAFHKYGFFPPGWEVHTAEWVLHFGNDDPCLAISSFLPLMFQSGENDLRSEKKMIVLDSVDRKIIDIILQGFRDHVVIFKQMF